MAKNKNIKGLDNYLRRLSKSIRRIKGNTLEGLLAAGLHVRRKSQPEVPVVTSNLKNSASVVTSDGLALSVPTFTGEDAAKLRGDHEKAESRQKGKLKRFRAPAVAILYSAFYAPFVHENPRAGKTGGVSPKGVEEKPEKGSQRQVFAEGGNWKFLEGPFRRERKKILQIIRDRAMIKKKDTL